MLLRRCTRVLTDPRACQGAAHDLWQAFLFAPPGEWADVRVPMSRFLKTWRGKVLDSEHEMNATKIVSLGISVAGGGALDVRAALLLRLCALRADTRAAAAAAWAVQLGG